MKLNITNTFIKDLPGDPVKENTRRQVFEACYSFVTPKKTSNPEMLIVSEEMANELGLNPEDLTSDEFLQILTGNKVMEETQPYAMCYGGHQFGSWAGQLGDGRAINLAEVTNNDQSYTLQLKGAGETPYSRTADGLAVLRSSIREFLCSEAMYHLGVPTTRALSLALSGDQVLRDVLYDGNPAFEKGAIVCRVAASFLRFGSYEIFASRRDSKTLKTLVDYTIKHHYAHLGDPDKATYIQFFKEVAEKTLDMIIHWQRVGFVHGVMNTDNLSILGLTIDYGPYGWLEGYDHGWTPNTTDNQNKRYRYGNQANIGLWNLVQLANALYPLIEEAEPLQKVVSDYKTAYRQKYLDMMKSKIGLFATNPDFDDNNLIQQLEENLQLTETDMTIFFRNLSNVTKASSELIPMIKDSFYNLNELSDSILDKWNNWFTTYQSRLQHEQLTDEERKAKMNSVNPKYVLRNYMAQLAIDDADEGNYDLLEELSTLLKKPYDEQLKFEKWFSKRPEWARNKVGSSMLSCSS